MRIRGRFLRTAPFVEGDTVRVLLENGADASAANDSGYTPLHNAAIQGNKVTRALHTGLGSGLHH